MSRERAIVLAERKSNQVAAMTLEPATNRVEIEGEVRDVIYENEKTGFAVVRIDVESAHLPLTATGRLFGLSSGSHVRLHGTYKEHPRFGRQFVVDFHEEMRPASRIGMIGYIAQHFEGVGKTLAERVVKHFGDRTYEILDADPTRVREVPGVGKKKAKRIAEMWKERRAVREATTFLLGFGVMPSQIERLLRQYGDATIALVRANPFRLADEIQGIGFKTADKIAQSLGMAKDAPERARAAILYLLSEALGTGHTLLPEHEALRRAQALEIGEERAKEAALTLVEEQLVVREAHAPGHVPVVAEPDSPTTDGELELEFVSDNARTWDRRGPVLYTPVIYGAETLVAESLASGAFERIELQDAVGRVQRAAKQARLELAPEQEAAIVRALTHKVAVITGGPGVGKTTIVRLLVSVLIDEEVKVELCAPTGRAAKRLSEATGRSALTIHRMLKFEPVTQAFGVGEHEPLEVDHLIVDECSMLDVPLAAALMRALPPHARLTLVGDADQLPSVGPGDFFRAVCAADGFQVSRLTQVFRQREGSRIVTGAHAVNRGEFPEFDPPGKGGEFYFIEREAPEAIAETIRQMVVERIPGAYGLDARQDIQVLTPMHKGSAGVENLNQVLGAALNPDPAGEVKRAGRTLRVGDRVVQIKNDYKKSVWNGDQGFVVAIDSADGTLTVRIDDENVVYEFDDLSTLLPAWATTVHRAQGGEHKAVVIALSNQHYPMLRRNLVYTAITRARQLCVIVGNRRALERAIATSASNDRYCFLEERLRSALAEGSRER